MSQLHLDGNSGITGPLPASISTMLNLTVLSINGLSINGSLPATLPSSLQTVSINNNTSLTP